MQFVHVSQRSCPCAHEDCGLHYVSAGCVPWVSGKSNHNSASVCRKHVPIGPTLFFVSLIQYRCLLWFFEIFNGFIFSQKSCKFEIGKIRHVGTKDVKMPELTMSSKTVRSTGDGEGGASYSKGSVLTARNWRSLEGVQMADLGTKKPDFLLPIARKLYENRKQGCSGRYDKGLGQLGRRSIRAELRH